MTVETATIVSTAVPPKKREYSCNGEVKMEVKMEQESKSSLQTVTRQDSSSPPLSFSRRAVPRGLTSNLMKSTNSGYASWLAS